MSSTFDSAKTQYQRKMARQKQMEKFEEVSTSLTPEGSEHLRRTSNYEWEHGDVAFESARRFLRDEDDNEEGGLQASASDSCHLWGGFGRQGSGSAKSKKSPLAGDDWDSSSIIRGGNEYGDEDLRSAYGNRSHHERELEQSRLSAILNPIGGFCVTCVHACFRPCSILSEYVIAAMLRFCSYTRKQKLILLGSLTLLGLAIWGIVALATRDGGGSSSSTNQDNGGNNNGGGHPFQPGHPLVPKDPARYEAIRAFIVDSGITHADHLDEQGSYQNHALWWVVDHDAAHVHTNTSGLLQRYALATLFFTTYVATYLQDHTNGTALHHAAALMGEHDLQWTDSDNWMTKKGVCDWYGVSCVDDPYDFNGAETSNVNTNIVRLELKENNIVGGIPSELVALDRLTTLDLGGNKLFGSIPKSFGELKHLVNLYLNDNELSGVIPAELAQCRFLRILDLTNNELVGSIPEHFASLPEMRTLNLAENMLAGQLPQLNMSHLDLLHLSDNQFTGTIPTAYGRLVTLKEMDLRNNELHGGIPSQFSSLSNLEVFSVGFNMLSGSLPFQIGEMARLTDLEIQHNMINGTIPDEIGLLSRVEVLHLERNELSGTIPEVVGMLTDLRVFEFSQNNLTGSVPAALCDPNIPPTPKMMSGDCSESGGSISCSCCERCHP